MAGARRAVFHKTALRILCPALGRLALCCLLAAWLPVSAQGPTWRTKWLHPGGLPLPVDTLSLDPGSVRVLYPADPALAFSYQAGTNMLRFTAPHLPDSVLVSYRVLPVWLGRTQYHRNPDTYDKVAYFGGLEPALRTTPPATDKREEFFTTKGIQKNGALTRGISFGNAQNVFVNSALNLQLEGRLTEGIALQAVISDQSVPFQPEGNTQSLQEFDRVFVHLSAARWQLAAGDIVFRNPAWRNQAAEPSQFLRYYKNVQGGTAQTNYRVLGGQGTTTVGVAVSKGKFASVAVPVTEGVQGPYRLRGAGNERFIVVLANSERIYLDGRLLQRGFNQEYVIDYNSAEITFTPAVVITEFSRVRADFEYSDRNYSRSIITASQQQQMGRLRLFGNYYNEKDNPRQVFALDLSEADKRLLSRLDDPEGLGMVSGVRPATDAAEAQIRYRRVDTLHAGQTYAVYVHTPAAAGAAYQVQFSEVGQGRGHYQRVRATTNGQVYEWVAPLNGLPQGGFDTLRAVPLPTQKRMLATGVEFRVSNAETLTGEVAFAQQDQNLFSRAPQSSTTGNAWKVGYANRGKNIRFLPRYQWLGSADYEQDSRQFRPIDRFRDVDFDRDWTLADTSAAADHIFNASVGIRRAAAPPDSSGRPAGLSAASATEANSLFAPPAAVPARHPAPSASFVPAGGGDQLTYQFSRRRRGQVLAGHQHRVEGAKQVGRLWLRASGFWLQAVQPRYRTDWQRLQAVAEYRGRRLAPGYAFATDKNRLLSRTVRDSVVGTAMNFDENRFFLRNGDSLKTRFQLDYALRRDYLPVEGRLMPYTTARTATGTLQSDPRRLNTLQATATYRTLASQFVPAPRPGEETLMGRVDWNGQWLNRSLRSELTLATASGRELRREFVFLPVPVGEGTHTWRDDNADGRQDLSEFYEAINPDEKRYAKFFVPTDTYIRAFTQNLSYRLQANTPVAWRQAGGMRQWLSRFSSVSAWTANRKTTDDALFNRLLPFGQPVRAAAVLSAQESLRNTLFYNRANPQYGADMVYLRTAAKQLLTGRADNGNSYELRQHTEWRINLRLNLGRQYSLRGTWATLVRGSESNFLAARNFRILGRQVGPELAFQPSAGFRLAGTYNFSLKENVLAESKGEHARTHAVSTEVRWAKVGRRTLAAGVRWVRIGFGGEANSPVGYELLEALRPGTNWTWNLNWQQRLANGLQINMGYDGRQSEGQRIIHLGRMQVTALF